MPSVDQGNIKTMDAWDSALKAASTGAAANSSSDPHARVGVRPDKDIQSIYRKNQEWKEGKLEEDPEFFNKLGSGHSPDYMWIGCADARVPANEIMGEDAGSVFVVRNVANLVVSTDFNLMAALQFAVNVLKVPHIIVCGHYDCGGVRASVEKKDHVPPLENWLRNIRDVYRLHRVELDAIKDPEQRHRRLVEVNVIEQCLNLFKTGAVQRRRVETYKAGDDYTTPRVHACVFDPKTGDMKRLQVNFREFMDDLHDIYDLYSLDDEDVLEDKPHAPEPLPTEPVKRAELFGQKLFTKVAASKILEATAAAAAASSDEKTE